MKVTDGDISSFFLFNNLLKRLYFSIETLPNGTFVSFGDNLILMMDIYNIWMMLAKNGFKNAILLF